MAATQTSNAAPQAAPVVTFDGPGGAGKGTLSRAVAAQLGWHLLDSGALYRLVALAATREALDPQKPEDIVRAADLAADLDVVFKVIDPARDAQVLLGGEDVSRAIRTEAVGNAASWFAAEPAVRSALLELQRRLRRAPGLVADGRDMGTVVFADAGLKIFVTASAGERARRRFEQLSQAGVDANIDRIYSEIVARDERDQSRAHSPLKPADDAVIIDTTAITVEQTLDRIGALLRDHGLAPA